MTQEDKALLLKDLCARIPYEVVGKCEIDASYDTSFDTLLQIHEFDAVVYGIKEDLLLVTPLIEYEDEQNFAEEEVADGVDILDFTPYLLPMSSMTDKDLVEFLQIKGMNLNSDELKTFRREPITIVSTLPSYSRHIDWLNAHHFDYRGLIEKGLAIDATGLNIY